MSEEQLKSDADRGNRAKRLLEDPLTQEAFMLLRADILCKFEATKFRDKEERDELWRQLKTIARFEEVFTQLVRDGKIAKSKLHQTIQRLRA